MSTRLTSESIEKWAAFKGVRLRIQKADQYVESRETAVMYGMVPAKSWAYYRPRAGASMPFFTLHGLAVHLCKARIIPKLRIKHNIDVWGKWSGVGGAKRRCSNIDDVISLELAEEALCKKIVRQLRELPAATPVYVGEKEYRLVHARRLDCYVLQELRPDCPVEIDHWDWRVGTLEKYMYDTLHRSSGHRLKADSRNLSTAKHGGRRIGDHTRARTI